MAVGTATKQINIVINAIDRTNNILDRLDRQIRSITSALVGMAAGFIAFNSIKNAIDSTVKFADETRKLSVTTGMSTVESSRLLYAVNKLGIEYNGLAAPLAQFERRLAGIELIQMGVGGGTKTALGILKDYGIATVDVQGKLIPFGEILGNVADKFASMKDDSGKTGILENLFSRAGSGTAGLTGLITLFNQGRSGIAALEAEADRLGVTLSASTVQKVYEFQQALKQSEAAVRGIQNVIAMALIPYLTQLSQWFVQHQPDIRKFFEDAIPVVKKFVTDFIAGMQALINAFTWINNNSGVVAASITAIGVAMVVAFGPQSAALAGLVYAVALLGRLNEGKRAVMLTQEDIDKSGFRGDALRLYKEANAQGQYNDTQDQLKKFGYGFGGNTDLQMAPWSPPGFPENTGMTFDPSAYDKQKELQYPKQLEDALEDAMISYKEFLNLNQTAAKEGFPELTVAMAAQLEAERQLADGTIKTQTRVYELGKEIEKLEYAAGKGSEAVALMAQDFLQKAVDLQQKGISDILGRPTRESAMNDVQLALVDREIAAHKEANNAIEETAKALKDRLAVQIDIITGTLTRMSRALDDTVYGLDQQKESLKNQIDDLRPGQVGTKKRLQDQIEAIDDQEKLLRRQHELATRPLDDQKKFLGDQGDAAVKAASSAGDALDKLRLHIQDEMTIRQTNLAVLKAEAVFADQALLTDFTQHQMVETLTRNFETLSGQLVTTNEFLGDSSIPTYQAAAQAVSDWTQALRDSKTTIQGGTPGLPGTINGERSPIASSTVNGDVHFHFAPGASPDAAYLMRQP